MEDIQIIETVTFKANDGVEDDALFAALRGIDGFLNGRDGFVRRHLSRGEDGTWLEHVVWENMEKALAAAAEFPGSPEAQAAMGFIDGATARVGHAPLIAYKAA